MTVQDITSLLETVAPLSFQEDYDNAGLLTGDKNWDCSGVLICLDTTEEIIEEAVSKNCNLVVAHHPILFRGLKQLTGKTYVERTIIKALRNNIAIYAIHTNLDSVKKGVNYKIAEKLQLKNLKILRPKADLLKKLVTFAPVAHAEEVKKSLFDAGAGEVGKYSECSFSQEGMGTFKAGEGAEPFIGELGKRHEEKEMKIEVIFPGHLQLNITEALFRSHPYEEVAYDILSLGNFFSEVGSGMIGDLPEPVLENQFLSRLKEVFHAKGLRHTQLTEKMVSRVAICGGSGIFLLGDAISHAADVFVTADIKYHEFFDAENRLLLVDMGHYESEQFTVDLLFDILSAKFPNFAILKTGINTNPVQYFG